MSNDVNHSILIGRLTRDATLKYTSGGMAVLEFSIANGYSKKTGDQWSDEVNYFDITLYGRQGESINQFMVKGKQVAVKGSLRQSRWEKDGQNHSRVFILADNVQLLGGGQQGAQDGGNGGGSQNANTGSPDAGYGDYQREPEYGSDIPF